MKYDLSIYFLLKKGQMDKKGLIPIYLRLTVNGKRSEISANRKTELLKWDSTMQRAKGRSEDARTLNDHLDNLENQIKRKYNSLNEKEEEISSEVLRDLLLGKEQKKYFLVTGNISILSYCNGTSHYRNERGCYYWNIKSHRNNPESCSNDYA